MAPHADDSEVASTPQLARIAPAITPTLERYRNAVKTYPICVVTGGSGYIGSHTVLELLTSGVAVVVIDNLCNSHMESLCRVYNIARAEFKRVGESSRAVPPLLFHSVDLRNSTQVNEVFAFWCNPDAILDPIWTPKSVGDISLDRKYSMLSYEIDAARRTKLLPITNDPSTFGKVQSVIHFAALKAVGESVSKPLEYYENNIVGLIILLKAMKAHNVKSIVFSSSAVVYGRGNELNISEDSVQVGGAGGGGGLLTNPYGRSKWMAEEILNDCCNADPSFHAISLRYFNPTGSHPSGLIGEDPKGVPNNIVPVILQAYQRRRSKVYIFGSNYDTADGTGVRDYIHVSDLAKGHLAALRKLGADHVAAMDPAKVGEQATPNYSVYNLGTGRGYSVLDILKAFSTVAGADIPFAMVDARAGDLGAVTASTVKAETELEWEAEFGLQDMCRDVYNWAASNPQGYEMLRRLSTIPASNPQALRKASVAAGVFKSEDDFDKFMTDGFRTETPLAGPPGRKMSSFGSMMRKLSVTASMQSIMQESGQENAFAKFSETGFGGLAQAPSFSVSWNNAQRRPLNTGMATTILEEEDAMSPTA